MLYTGKGGKTSPKGKKYLSCLGLYSTAPQRPAQKLMEQITLSGKTGPTRRLVVNTQKTKENPRRTYNKVYHAPVFPQGDLA